MQAVHWDKYGFNFLRDFLRTKLNLSMIHC